MEFPLLISNRREGSGGRNWRNEERSALAEVVDGSCGQLLIPQRRNNIHLYVGDMDDSNERAGTVHISQCHLDSCLALDQVGLALLNLVLEDAGMLQQQIRDRSLWEATREVSSWSCAIMKDNSCASVLTKSHFPPTRTSVTPSLSNTL